MERRQFLQWSLLGFGTFAGITPEEKAEAAPQPPCPPEPRAPLSQGLPPNVAPLEEETLEHLSALLTKLEQSPRLEDPSRAVGAWDLHTCDALWKGCLSVFALHTMAPPLGTEVDWSPATQETLQGVAPELGLHLVQQLEALNHLTPETLTQVHQAVRADARIKQAVFSQLEPWLAALPGSNRRKRRLLRLCRRSWQRLEQEEPIVLHAQLLELRGQLLRETEQIQASLTGPLQEHWQETLSQLRARPVVQRLSGQLRGLLEPGLQSVSVYDNMYEYQGENTLSDRVIQVLVIGGGVLLVLALVAVSFPRFGILASVAPGIFLMLMLLVVTLVALLALAVVVMAKQLV